MLGTGANISSGEAKGRESNRSESGELPVSKGGTNQKTSKTLATVVFVMVAAAGLALAYSLWRKKGQTKTVDPLDWNPLVTEIEGSSGAPMRLSLLSDSPRVVLVANFLSPKECDALVDLGEPLLKRSTVQGSGDGGVGGKNVVSRERTSWTANLKKAQDAVTERVERRAALLTGYPVANLEPLQIVRYEPGQQYTRHFDYFVAGTKGADEALKQGGQRRVTLFVYLNDVEEGGETHFTEINLKVAPRKGSAVMFLDCTPDGREDPRTAHAGLPPKRGVKYGCNVWIREGAFR